MGGLGSTRWRGHERRRSTHEATRLEAKAAATQAGLANVPGTWELRVNVPVQSMVVSERVTVEAAPQPFGGIRWWWRCPGCGARRRALFVMPLTAVARCRRCLGLAYESQRANPLGRLTRRALHGAEQLGARDAFSLFVTGVPPDRPPGMHRRTYETLVNDLMTMLTARDEIVLERARAILYRSSRRK
jgi:hypothetical protein